MKMKQSAKLTFSALLVTLGLYMLQMPSPAFAAGPIADPNSSYAYRGTIDDIDLTANHVVIDDRLFVLANDIQIHSGREKASKYMLRKGHHIGYSLNKPSTGYQVVTEIWILP